MTLFATETETPRTGKCGACRKVLTDPKWIALGFGKCCAKRLGLIPARRPRGVSLSARVRAGGDVEGQGDLLAEER
ncbi:DUF6011 domain-containing protein [Streptosporangium sp. NBC_01755]|uniref:DUF6011 domain-containing protein n=1 Tax=Streptosporangium sp. NBC_01755 TaxID=2975949 RepID=UPI002DD8ADB2|nr:DUF6011 domain-containing protein [Streptosporangium sp. NBC_01755]WSD01475.1 DUF6011 domain-containing protein [Streptosporangium sp. NBC_01755]